MENMKVIFIGGLYPKERENEIRENSIGRIDNAANNFQWALLKGLDNFYSKIKVVSAPSIKAYPFNYKKRVFKESSFKHNSKSTDYCIGFINLPLIRHISRERSVYEKLNKITHIGEQTLIIIYSIHSPFLKAAVKFKNKNSNVTLCLIAPDLPQYMSESKNPIYRSLKYIDSKIINKCLYSIDCFVLLSDAMKEAVKVGNRPWIRIEGLFDSDNKMISSHKEKYKTILYTGSLEKRFGILNLLDAFDSIQDPDYRLWICGDGDTRNEIIERANDDSRIKYFGEIPYHQILLLQKKATVLVNPRTSEGDFTKYSFPSKTMEYLASGTPAILHRLQGIPDEYFDYCYVAEEENKEGLKNKILEVCERPQLELNRFGERASDFIIENKNSFIQAQKIYDMINLY